MPRAQSEDQAFPQSMIVHHQQTVDMAFFDDMVVEAAAASRQDINNL